MAFAKEFFGPLHGNFQTALKEGKVVTCLLIQALLIEAFAISAYHIYIPVADPFARKITEGVVKDEYTHLNYGQEWLKANFEASREELMEANKVNLPRIRSMLEQVAKDAASAVASWVATLCCRARIRASCFQTSRARLRATW